MWWRKPSTSLGWLVSETAVKPGLTHPYTIEKILES
jgi:hypothetical protein